ncbi:MAG: antibiotic biosynthesis monooxygenase [bacterium]
MVLEVALIDVRDSEQEAFAAAYRSVRSVLAGTPGVRSVRMTAGIERPTRFVLLVEWDSVHAHEQNFRASDRFVRWRAAIGPYFAAPPLVEHYADVAVA